MNSARLQEAERIHILIFATSLCPPIETSYFRGTEVFADPRGRPVNQQLLPNNSGFDELRG